MLSRYRCSTGITTAAGKRLPGARVQRTGGPKLDPPWTAAEGDDIATTQRSPPAT
jgi:hypothetical protein